MQALVLVGGYGTRLRPLTYYIPKAMVPIANIPFIDRMMRYLKANGVEHAILTLCYLPEQIRKYFEEHNCGVKIDLVFEQQPLGTGGAIKNAEHLLDDEFLVFNGDILTTIDLKTLVAFHREHDALVTIALTPVDNPSLYGVVIADSDGRIQEFVEKPPISHTPSNLINAGIYVYRKDVLSRIPPRVEYSVERQLYPNLLKEGARMFAISFPNDYWIDIGSIDKYMMANFDAIDGKIGIEIGAEMVSDGVWIEFGAKVSEKVDILPPILIGSGTIIENGACIGPYAIIGRNVSVGFRTKIERAIIWDGCNIGANAHVKETILGFDCKVEDNAITKEHVYACKSKIRAKS